MGQSKAWGTALAAALSLGVAFSALAQFNRAASFGFSNAGLDAPMVNPLGLDSPRFTFETWVNALKFNVDHGEIGRYSGEWGGVQRIVWEMVLRTSSTDPLKVYPEFKLGDHPVSNRSRVFRRAEWHHVAGTYDGAMVRVYIDGDLAAEEPYTGVVLGAGANRRFESMIKMEGQLDEVRVWSEARTQEQIRCSMTNTLDLPASNLRMYFHLDEATGTRFDDAGPYDNDATGREVTHIASGARYLGQGLPPTINTHPVGADVCDGYSTRFSVAASGYHSLTYQWLHDGQPLQNGTTPAGSRIAGAQTPNLTITDIRGSDAGEYTCRVTGPCSSADSRSALLVVGGLREQPTAMTTCATRGAALRVQTDAFGQRTFQWRREGVPLAEATGRFAGTRTNTLRIGNAQPTDAGLYDCVITGACGEIVSAAAAVDVYCDCDQHRVFKGVRDNFAGEPEVASPSAPLRDFIVDRTNRQPLDYDQVPGVNGVPGFRMFGETFSNLPDDVLAGILSFRAMAGNGSPRNDTVRVGFASGRGSSAVFDEVYARPFGTVEGDEGLSGLPWTFQTTYNPNLNLVSMPLTGGASIDILPNIRARGFLDVLVREETGVDWMQLEYFTPAPGAARAAYVAAHPRNTTVCGGPAVFRVTPGGSGPFTYQWYRGTPGNATPLADQQGRISGSRSARLTIEDAQITDEGAYFCRVSNGSCRPSANSLPATLSVRGLPCAGLIARYTFDDCTGHDSSGLGNVGTLFGSPTCAAGISGQGLRLDGNDDYVRIRNASVLNPTNEVTVAVWIKPDDFGGGNYAIVSKVAEPSFGGPFFYQVHLGITGSVAGSDYLFSWDVNTDDGGTRHTRQISTPRFTWQPGRWYFVVGTYDGNEMALTAFEPGLNGEPPRITRVAEDEYGTMTDFGQDWTIGAYANWSAPGGPRPRGMIDEVRLYDRALAEGEIRHLFDSRDGHPLIAGTPNSVVGRPASFSIQSRIPVGCESFEWQRNEVRLADVPGHIQGSSTPTLSIARASLSDMGLYRVVVHSPCGSQASNEVRLACPSDLDDGSGTGAPDGGVTIDDLVYFLGAFEEGNPRADVDDGSGAGTPDGGVTIDDLLYYLFRFESGC